MTTDTEHQLRSGGAFRRHVLTSTLWAAGGRVALTLGGLLLNIVLARSLPAERVGDYFLLLTFVTTAATVGRLGQGEAIVRVVADAVANRGSGAALASLRRSFQIALITSAVAALVVVSPLGDYLAGDLLGIDDYGSFAFLAGAWVLLQVLQVLLSESFRSLHQIQRATLFGGAAKNLIVAAVLVLLLLRPDDLTLTDVVVSTVLVLAVSNAAALRLLWRSVASFERGAPAERRPLLDIGVPLMLNTLAIFLIVRVNLWILGAFTSSVDVALYGAAVQFVTLVTTPLLLLNAVLPPIIAERYPRPDRHASLERTLRTLTTMVSVPSLVVLVAFSVFAGPLLEFVFGSVYRDASTALVVLAIGQSANVWSGPCGVLLKMADRHRLLLAINVATGLGVIIAGLLVVPDQGVTGAAVVSSVAVVAQNVAQVVAARRGTGILTTIELSPRVLRAEVSASLDAIRQRPAR